MHDVRGEFLGWVLLLHEYFLLSSNEIVLCTLSMTLSSSITKDIYYHDHDNQSDHDWMSFLVYCSCLHDNDDDNYNLHLRVDLLTHPYSQVIALSVVLGITDVSHNVVLVWTWFWRHIGSYDAEMNLLGLFGIHTLTFSASLHSMWCSDSIYSDNDGDKMTYLFEVIIIS